MTMRTNVQSLFQEMEGKLDRVAIDAENNIKMILQSIQTVQDFLQRLKKEIEEHPFLDAEEEVAFFKKVKPGFEKYLHYYIGLHRFEQGQMESGRPSTDKLIEREYKEMEADIKRHREFYYYYKTGSTFLDNQYFIRANQQTIVLPEYLVRIDPSFGTVYGYLVAKIEANDLLKSHFQSYAGGAAIDTIGNSRVTPTVKWTASKTDCVEFIYGLYANGCLNNGNMDIGAIASFIEKTFNISVGNVYRVFQDIRIRKIRTKFFDETKEKLMSFIDYADEHPRFN